MKEEIKKTIKEMNDLMDDNFYSLVLVKIEEIKQCITLKMPYQETLKKIKEFDEGWKKIANKLAKATGFLSSLAYMDKLEDILQSKEIDIPIGIKKSLTNYFKKIQRLLWDVNSFKYEIILGLFDKESQSKMNLILDERKKIRQVGQNLITEIEAKKKY